MLFRSDRLKTPVCSLGMVVRSVIIIQCAVEHVPHLHGADRVALRSIPVQSSDVIILEPVQNGSQFVVDASISIIECIQCTVDEIYRVELRS